MPNAPHDALHHVFRDDADLINRTLLEVCGTDLHVTKASELNVDTTELRPLERRSDTILDLELADRGPCILVVESQTRRDDDKIETWPQLISHLHAKYHRPVALLVITQRPATAVWARKPIVCGIPGLPPTLTLSPFVLGPDNTPKITDLAEASADVGFAVLSAMVHGSSGDATGILETLMDALGTVEVSTAICYAEFTEAALQNTPAALELWKALMKTNPRTFVSELRAEAQAEGRAKGLAEGRLEGRTEGRTEGRIEGRIEGRAEGRLEGEARGEAEALLLILEHRGITVPHETRARIISCTNTRQLGAWIQRALDITDVNELFD